MLSDIFKPFIEGSPLSVMMRGLVERLLNPEQMDRWFKQFTQEQYTRELLFSTVVSLMLEVAPMQEKGATETGLLPHGFNVTLNRCCAEPRGDQ